MLVDTRWCSLKPFLTNTEKREMCTRYPPLGGNENDDDTPANENN